ncbi:hypothetical protein Hdeb2414_s0022g00611421 [Helianthus debilis subsp. tardiflorus]
MKILDLWSSSMKSWREEINESRNWQDGIFFALCFLRSRFRHSSC